MPDTKKNPDEERIKKFVEETLAKRDAADLEGKMTVEQKNFARMVARETAAAVVRELQSADEDESEEEKEDRPRDFFDEIFSRRKAKK
jgi:hypothetical protein